MGGRKRLWDGGPDTSTMGVDWDLLLNRVMSHFGEHNEKFGKIWSTSFAYAMEVVMVTTPLLAWSFGIIKDAFGWRNANG
ncbi:hypothetical protein V6N13_046305 [Hibiscus sabdariffa]